MPCPAPDESRPGHYKSYSSMKGTEPTDKHVPSLMEQTTRQVAEGLQGINPTKLTAQHARSSIKCRQCKKPRVVYAVHVLTTRQKTSLKRLLSAVANEFECGCMVTPDNHDLDGKVFTRMTLTCASVVETAYYSTKNFKSDKSICCYCLAPGQIISEDMKAEYCTVLPLCHACMAKGRTQKKWGKRQQSKKRK